jgi:DNA-binding SARP family transcriptional activator
MNRKSSSQMQTREPEIEEDARYAASLFGPFRISLNGQPLGEPTWRRNRARTMLKWFLVNPVEPFSEDQLCVLFWPDRNRQKAANSLHVTLHYLRHVLEPELPPRSPSTFIRRNGQKYYWFDPRDLWWTDVREVQTLCAAAEEAKRKGDTQQAISLYEQSLAYYRLTFLPEDVYEDVFTALRCQHDIAHSRSLRHLMHLYLRVGQLPNALSCAMQMLAIDAYNEDAVKTIVHVYLRQGNYTGAIRQLDDFFDGLRRHMGIKPNNELLALRTNIMLSR